MEFLIVTAFVALVVAGIAYAFWLEKKRTDAIRALALSNGFTFSEKAPSGLDERTGEFKLFNKGHSRRITNAMVQAQSAFTVSQFDYSYTIGSGKSSTTYRQTVTLIETKTAQFPPFVLGPENVFHRLGDVMGIRDIDFDDYPEFSKRYLLKGDDEVAVRELFTPALLEHFTTHLGFSIEGLGGGLIVYRGGTRTKPEQIAAELKARMEIFTLFHRAARHSG